MQEVVYFFSRILFLIVLKIAFKFKVTGRSNLPKKGPFIMASNHISYADPVVMGVACNTVPIHFMAKKELFNVPFFHLWFKAVGCIPVDRNSKSSAPLKNAIQKLKKGKAIGIFPEGKRSKTDEPLSPEPGIGLIVSKTKVPIIPLYISGTETALPIGKSTLTPCRVSAKIGKAVDIEESMKLSGKKEIYESIGKKVIDAIFRLKSEIH